ncbi:hypothetical protein [Deinococcus gobiensis]|uniref:Uncharacterized protein n=1 Tax=Deinococcus gobiensis (strain DSM 21396 / JCM 16679 / CGMCC 1.7299 / I-0) TaxID=745776 RepID=H8H104_DEIGI|nr:hypothetical protein [Deinococcus gobiensis]AFD27023.1 hypothetical protein DGo_PA0137 [Deinococcus gobiensis I-0]
MKRPTLSPNARTVWAALLLPALGAAAWTLRPAPDDLYCVARPGTLWNGLAPVPDGLRPRCPASATYRREVQGGLTRVEQYVAPGWQPRLLLEPLKRAGYVLLEDETRGDRHYSVFLGRSAPAQLYYTAVPEGPNTLLTLSGH